VFISLSHVQLNLCVLYLEFQAAARQQLERLPRRQTQTTSSTNSAGAGTTTATTAAATGSHTAVPLDATLNQAATSNSQFLLSR
jgi:hypothetical protein